MATSETESDPQTPIACQSIHMGIFLQIGDKRNVMAKDSLKKGIHIIHHCCIIVGKGYTLSESKEELPFQLSPNGL
jgi:hypothetical protein